VAGSWRIWRESNSPKGRPSPVLERRPQFLHSSTQTRSMGDLAAGASGLGVESGMLGREAP
jgi:hypothetical protein